MAISDTRQEHGHGLPCSSISAKIDSHHSPKLTRISCEPALKDLVLTDPIPSLGGPLPSIPDPAFTPSPSHSTKTNAQGALVVSNPNRERPIPHSNCKGSESSCYCELSNTYTGPSPSHPQPFTSDLTPQSSTGSANKPIYASGYSAQSPPDPDFQSHRGPDNPVHSSPKSSLDLAESPERVDSDRHQISGRKAARSLRIFRNMHCYTPQLQLPKDLHAISVHVDADTMLSPLKSASSLPGLVLLANLDHMSVLEPVLLATYFPHTPVDVAHHSIDSHYTTAHADNSQLQPKHMAADVEFDCLADGRIKLTNVDHHYEAKLVPEETETRPQTPDAQESIQVPPSPRFPLSVELRPFANKVGGHTAIFSFLKRAVCKALVNLENVFYETVEVQHPELLEFMPKYIGVLNVRYSSMVSDHDLVRADSDPQVHLAPNNDSFKDNCDVRCDNRKATNIARPESHSKPTKNYDPSAKALPRSYTHLPHSGYLPEVVLDDNTHIIPSSLWRRFYTADDKEDLDLRPRSDVGHIGSTLVNTHLQEEIMQEVFRPWPGNLHDLPVPTAPIPAISLCKHTRFEQYILLEDLTSNMKRPCVLDLKMGTRQYGVDALAKKQELQRRKCAATTSRQLGVRVCGLQIFHKNRAEPIIKNKYFGRRVRAGAQFCRILALYLYDGKTSMLVLEKIGPLVRRLRRLYKVCQELKGYRLYGLLVLLMHDAASESDSNVKVKIIDFARLAVPGHSDNGAIPPAHPQEADQGYLRGLLTLITYFETIFVLVSGHEIAQVGDVSEFLSRNAAKYAASNYWLDQSSAIEYGELSDADIVATGDPFERHYNYDFPDVEVSE